MSNVKIIFHNIAFIFIRKKIKLSEFAVYIGVVLLKVFYIHLPFQKFIKE